MKTVSGKQFCKILENRGWTLDRMSSSHHLYKRPGTLRHICVPVHGNQDLGKGLQRTLMRQAGLTDADL